MVAMSAARRGCSIAAVTATTGARRKTERCMSVEEVVALHKADNRPLPPALHDKVQPAA
jgi:hypothetical protein